MQLIGNAAVDIYAEADVLFLYRMLYQTLHIFHCFAQREWRIFQPDITAVDTGIFKNIGGLAGQSFGGVENQPAQLFFFLRIITLE